MSNHMQWSAVTPSGTLPSPALPGRPEITQTVALGHCTPANLAEIADNHSEDDNQWMAELQTHINTDFSAYVSAYGWPTAEETSDEIWLAMCGITAQRKGEEQATQARAPPVKGQVNYTYEHGRLRNHSEKENIAPVAGPSMWHSNDATTSISSVLPTLLTLQEAHYPPLGAHNHHERSPRHHTVPGSSWTSSSSSAASDSSTAIIPQCDAVAPTGSFLCRWGGSIGCQYMIHRTTSNGALIRHLELEHGFNGKILAADGVNFDGRSRTGAKCQCKWEGCSPGTKLLKSSQGLLRHIKTGSHVRRAH